MKKVENIWKIKNNVVYLYYKQKKAIMEKSKVKRYVEAAITLLLEDYERSAKSVLKSKNKYKNQLKEYYEERVESLKKELEEVVNNFTIEE